MKKFTNRLKLSLLVALTFSLALMTTSMQAMSMEGGLMAGHGMTTHHQHILLNHALLMTLEGSNLIMLGEMKMAKDIDTLSNEHGRMMMKNGRSILTEIMSGKAMMTMHDKGKDPLKDSPMAYTHQLAEKQLIVMDVLEKMHGQAGGAKHGMTMHHQHMMLNHALKMALEGSNNVMIGQMGMAKGVDEISMNHGKMMMKNAQDLYNDVMSGDTMMKMHKEGTTMESNEMMKETHRLAEAQLQVMNMLNEMEAMGQ